MRIVLDLQGCQSVSRFRGIGRYSMALAKAMARNAGQHEIWIALSDLFPGTIEPIRAEFEGVLPSARIVTFSLPPLTPYQHMHDWRVRAAELIREHAIAELSPDLVHISSLFEGYVDTTMTSVKAFDKRVLTAVTLYDLIPFVDPAKHLPDEARKLHYYDKIEALKRADMLLAISDFCSEEAQRVLRISPNRITSISSAASDTFQRRVISETDVRELYERFALSRPFVMSTGIVEPRKNFDGLIVAFSMLPVELRRRHQLLIVCQPTERDRARLADLAEKHGLGADELVLADYVSDQDLIALYSLCHLFVFPSFHEGFGLPALEAMACGAAVIGSNATSIPEVIGREDALFDPHDSTQIAAMMERALSDAAYWQDLRDRAADRVKLFSWDATAKRAIRGFEQAFAQASSQGRVLSSDDRYRDLITALTALGEAAPETDTVAAAHAISSNLRSQRVPQLLVDVSILSGFDARSGIQRVTRSILSCLLNSSQLAWSVRPVRLDREHMEYRYANAFLRMLDPSADTEADDDWVDSHAGDVFLGLDLIADVAVEAEAWFVAQRDRGIQIHFVVYDLLPVLHPEWFHEGIARCFPTWIATIARVADSLISISRAVADDVEAWLTAARPERLRDIRLGYFHLGADIENSKPSVGMPANADEVLQRLEERPTFVMVGTVEPRKGHQQAFAAFEALWTADVDVNLVIVGKAGWGIDDLPEKLARHADLNKRFVWLQGISDEFLDKVYASSSCLLAASLGEGFGLPLIEAAQKGLPILARDIPVFREVAGNNATYFEGDAPDSLASAVKAWIKSDREGVARSSRELPWLTWTQSAQQLCFVLFDQKPYKVWHVPKIENK